MRKSLLLVDLKREGSALVFLAAGALLGGASIAARAQDTNHPDVLNFDMWCLEMQMYDVERCDARRPGDLRDYQDYVTSTERFLSEKRAGQNKDQELRDLLNRDPTTKGPAEPSGKQ